MCIRFKQTWRLCVAAFLLSACGADVCTKCLNVAGTYDELTENCGALLGNPSFEITQDGSKLVRVGQLRGTDRATLLDNGSAKFDPDIHGGDYTWWSEGTFGSGASMTFKGKFCEQSTDDRGENAEVTCHNICWRRR